MRVSGPISRALCPTILFASLAAAGAHAQVASSTAAPGALVDSVYSMPPALLQSTARTPPADGAPAAAHLLHGVAAKRMYELEPANERMRQAAERSFDRAKDADQGLAWAHYGYGWALARAGDLRIPLPGLRRIVGLASITEVVGLDATSRAQRALRRALELDPGLRDAASDLGRLALVTRSGSDVREAIGAIRTVLQRTGGDADTYLMLAELHMMRSEVDAAGEAVRAAMELRRDHAATLRLLSLTMLASPAAAERELGAGHYLDALALAAGDTAVTAAYEADIVPIVVPGELQAWRLAPAADRPEWLRAFWEGRAADAVLPLGDRLAEHFRRLRVAGDLYIRNAEHGSRSGEAILARPLEDLPFDDRGMVYMRYGRPDTTITTPATRHDLPPPNETWVYFRSNEKPLSFDFFKVEGNPDWVIAEAPRCYPFFFALGLPNRDAGEPAELRGRRGTVEEFSRWYEDRAFIDPRYALVSGECRRIAGNIRTAVNGTGWSTGEELIAETRDHQLRQLEQFAQTRRRIENALRTEDARPRYDRPLPVLTTVYSFRGVDDTDVSATLLIPTDAFTAATSTAGASVYPVRVSLMLRDSLTGAVSSAHEIARFGSAERLPAGRYFRVMVHTNSPAFNRGDYRLRVENEFTPEEGQVQVAPHAVRDFRGSALALSDVVVAEAEGGRWTRGDVTISPIPTHQIETGRTFQLFYEVYNLPQDEPYRTTLRIAPAEAVGTWDRIRGLFGRGRTIELSFDETAGVSNGKYGMQEIRSIRADLSPASYTVTISVTNLRTGVTVERSAPLNVIQVQTSR